MGAERASLTLRQARVARLVAVGRTDEEIAAQLGSPVVEIERAVTELLHKLDLRSRTELALLLLPQVEGEPGAADVGVSDRGLDG